LDLRCLLSELGHQHFHSFLLPRNSAFQFRDSSGRRCDIERRRAGRHLADREKRD
jgi:hypothetical protein